MLFAMVQKGSRGADQPRLASRWTSDPGSMVLLAADRLYLHSLEVRRGAGRDLLRGGFGFLSCSGHIQHGLICCSGCILCDEFRAAQRCVCH